MPESLKVNQLAEKWLDARATAKEARENEGELKEELALAMAEAQVPTVVVGNETVTLTTKKTVSVK